MRAPSAAVAGIRAAPLPFSRLALAAFAGAALALWLAYMADRRRAELALLALLPVLCLWLPALAALARSLVDRWLPWLARWREWIGPHAMLLAMLALVPLVVFTALSFRFDLLVPRAFLLFTPFYLLLTAAGLAHATRTPAARLGAMTAAVALFLGSAAYFHARPMGPQDYRGAAAIIAREQKPGDVVLLRKGSWADTPIIYYLRHADYMTEQQPEALAARRPPRVWLAKGENAKGLVVPDRRNWILAESGYVERRFWRVRGARVMLFEPGGAPSRSAPPVGPGDHR